VLEYTWDDAVPVEERKHEAAQCIKCCPVHEVTYHTAGEDICVHFDTVMEENKRKNAAIKHLLEVLPAEAKAGEYVFKEGEEPTWRFDENRNVILSCCETAKPYMDAAKAAMVADPALDDAKILLE
jgi:hypothetical protein